MTSSANPSKPSCFYPKSLLKSPLSLSRRKVPPSTGAEQNNNDDKNIKRAEKNKFFNARKIKQWVAKKIRFVLLKKDFFFHFFDLKINIALHNQPFDQSSVLL